MIETKVWGTVEHLFRAGTSTSILDVNAGFRCSIHYHKHRWNAFVCTTAKILVIEYDDKLVITDVVRIDPGRAYTVAPNVIHQFEVLQSGQLAEVYWTEDGSSVDPNDIVRFTEGGKV